MANKGKSLTKVPRKPGELQKLEITARKIGGDMMKAYLLMRYAGMHPRVIFPYDYRDEVKIKEYNLHGGFDENKREALFWDRPKKRGAKAFTSIPKHPNIDFDVDAFLKEIRGRKSHYKKSTLYANRLIRELGQDENVNIFGLSPLSLRHTLCVELLNGGMKMNVVCDTLNITATTARTYARLSPEVRHNEYDRAMGLV